MASDRRQARPRRALRLGCAALAALVLAAGPVEAQERESGEPLKEITSQVVARAKEVVTDFFTVRLVIESVRPMPGDRGIAALAAALPGILEVALMDEDWLRVTRRLETLPGPEAESGTALGRRFVLTGSVVRVGGKVRVDLIARDAQGTTVSEFAVFEPGRALGALERLAERLADGLEVAVVGKPRKLRVAVAPRFGAEGATADRELEDFIPDALRVELPVLAGRELEMVELPASEPEIPSESPPDFKISGTYSLAEEKLRISSWVEEDGGPTFDVEVEGPERDPFGALDELLDRVGEVIRGRTSPDGRWRQEELLAGELEPERFLREIRESPKSGDREIVLLRWIAQSSPQSRRPALVELGRIFLSQGEFAKAAREFERVLGDDSRDSEAALGLARAFQGLGDYEQGIALLEKLLGSPSLAPGVRRPSRRILADLYLLAERDVEAIELLRRAVDEAPDAALYMQLGGAYWDAGRTEESLATLDEALARFPEDAELRDERASLRSIWADTLAAEGRWGEAAGIFEEIGEDAAVSADIRAQALLGSARIVSVLGPESIVDLPRAVRLLEQATELDPANVEVLRYLGLTQMEQARYQLAAKTLQRAIEIAPSASLYRDLAQVHRYAGDLERARAVLEQSRELGPLEFESYIELGLIHQTAGAHREALAAFDRALEIEPRSEWAYRLKGISYGQLELYDEAIASLERGLEMQPTPRSHWVLGEVYRKRGERDLALEHLSSALELDPSIWYVYQEIEQVYGEDVEGYLRKLGELVESHPDWYVARMELGITLSNAGRHEQALEVLRAALQMRQEDEWLFRVLGNTYKEMEDFARARENLEKAIALSPTKWAYLSLGEVYHRDPESNSEEAEALYESAIELDPRYIEAYDALEKLYSERENGRDAWIERLEAAKESDPDWGWLRSSLGLTLHALGRTREALPELKRASELQPDDDWTWYLLGVSYLGLENFEGAVTALERSLELRPTAHAYLALGQTYRRNGELELAEANVVKALEMYPPYEEAHLEQAELYMARDEPRRAVAALTAALGLLPESAAVNLALARSYHQLGEIEQAEEHAQTARSSLRADDGYGRLSLAELELEHGHFETAAVDGLKAFNIDPTLGGALFVMASSYHELGRDDDLVKKLEALEAERPGNFAVLDTLGFVYHEYLFQFDKALAANREVFAQSPNEPEARADLAENCLTARLPEEALRQVRVAIGEEHLTNEVLLTLKMLEIAALVILDRTGEAFAQLGEFTRRYRDIPKGYRRSWSYTGLRHFVDTELEATKRDLLLDLIDLLRAPAEEADERLELFQASLQERFDHLTAPAAATSAGPRSGGSG